MAKASELNIFYLLSLPVIILAHLLMLSRLEFLPFPELLIYPYLTNIGITPYVQIFDQHFLGLMFFPVNLGNMGFATPQALFSLHLIVVSVIHLLLFTVTYKKTGSVKVAFMSNFFYLLWQPFWEGNMLWIDSFMPLMLLPAYYLFDLEKSRKMFYSGLFLGIGLLFKQVIAPLAILLSIYMFLKNRQKLAYFWSGYLIAPLLMIGYIFSIGAFSDFWYWTVTFNLTTFAEFGRKFATRGELYKFLIVMLPALLFINTKLKINKKILAIFIFSSLFYAYARFDLLHLQPVLPFLCFGLALYFDSLPKLLSKPAIFAYILIASYFLAPYHVALSGGGYKFFGATEDKLAGLVGSYSDEGDPIFAMATTPHLYYLSNTRPSGNVFVFPFHWFSMEAEDKILEGLERDPPKVIARDETATTGGVNLVEYMPKINQFINENYEVIDSVENIEVLIQIR